MDTPAATLPGAWCFRVSAGTGWPGVSILWLDEVESLICSFYLSVAARKIEQIRPWDTLACCWDVKQPTNKITDGPFQFAAVQYWSVTGILLQLVTVKKRDSYGQLFDSSG